MTYSELIQAVQTVDQLRIIDAAGNLVAAHAHLTEVALVRKHFIDCGGTERRIETVTLQLFVAGDTDHRLAPSKLLGILNAAIKQLGLRNEEVFIEYQQESLSTFGLRFDGMSFHLTPLYTNCLASDSCGIQPTQMPERPNTKCTPGSGCC
jgi:hypothetical protein